MKTQDEFEKAFEKTQTKYPHLTRSLARYMIATLEMRMTESRRKGLTNTFRGDLNTALNDLRLKGDDRSACRSFAGTFFGVRSGYMRRGHLRSTHQRK